MTLAPDTRLGAYEVVGSIGEGGMGEVYRARDTTQPDPLSRARQAAARSIEVNAMCQAGWEGLASSHFFGRAR